MKIIFWLRSIFVLTGAISAAEYHALLDQNGVVSQVHVIDAAEVARRQKIDPTLNYVPCKDPYNPADTKEINYPGIGYSKIEGVGFVAPKQFKTWTLDTQKAAYIAPVEKPPIDPQNPFQYWHEPDAKLGEKDGYWTTDKTLASPPNVDASVAQPIQPLVNLPASNAPQWGRLAIGGALLAGGFVAFKMLRRNTIKKLLVLVSLWSSFQIVYETPHCFAATTVDVLVQAGGGGGGSGGGGGGGAGGQVNATAYTITSGSGYTATISAGGAAETTGSNAVFDGATAIGGGSGGHVNNVGNGGGSGGGGGADGGGKAGGNAAQGNSGGGTGYGNNGGLSPAASSPYPCGAGGGAGAVGGAGSNGGGGVGGAGGAGRTYLNGTVYGGGGGGGIYSGTNGGAAGSGGGGTGGHDSGNGGNGTANTGGGGGGSSDSGTGGTGGSGVVIVTALLGVITSATGGTPSSDATYAYWTFTSSGTWTPTFSAGGSHNGDFFQLLSFNCDVWDRRLII